MTIFFRGKSILASVLFFCTCGSSWAESPAQEILNRAVQFHKRANSYLEWSESEHSPEALADRLAPFLKTSRGQAEVCRALRKFKDFELFFASDLLENSNKLSKCLSQQHLRYQNFLSATSAQLLQKTTTQKTTRDFLGPSTEIKLDNKSTDLIVNGDLPKKTLVLTFDDGPHPTRTLELLKLLKKEQATVQFFLVGQNTSRFNEIVQLAAADGHEIGCHSNTHPDLRKLKLAAAIDEIEVGFKAINEALGYSGSFFRFPYGAWTSDLRNHLRTTNTTEFLWNIDTLDWKYPDPEFLLEFAMAEIKKEDRGVVLMHDIQPQTLAIMPALLDRLKSSEYQLAIFRPSGPRTVIPQP